MKVGASLERMVTESSASLWSSITTNRELMLVSKHTTQMIDHGGKRTVFGFALRWAFDACVVDYRAVSIVRNSPSAGTVVQNCLL